MCTAGPGPRRGWRFGLWALVLIFPGVAAAPIPSLHLSQLPAEFRTIDGFGNNAAHPLWGSAGTALARITSAAYADGIGAPAGSHRRSAREISNIVLAQEGPIPNAAGFSDFLWQWGQFLDHDLDLVPVIDPPEPFPIPVPLGDPFFDSLGTGREIIPLNRSFYTVSGGVRQQMNTLTAFIDASNVYGSDAARALELRTLDGTGRLKTSEGDLLPFNVNGFPNAPSADDPRFFLAGDIRANEQVGLTAMHTLFVREHNFWAAQVARALRCHPRAGLLSRRERDDFIYECARAIVGAEMQVITYREFLPVLLGPDALPPYHGYDPDMDPSIANEFATAALRVGHTMLSPTLLRLDRRGRPLPEGPLPLADSFFNPEEIVERGIDPLLRGLAHQRAQAVDARIVDAVRNFLFGPPGAGGFDLASLNIQRGRDHGLPSYNAARGEMGLAPVASFAQITSDPATQARLAAAYDSVADIDLWVGGIAEDHVPGAQVGETFRTILSVQFTALRDGDRFWYQRHLPPKLVSVVERQTLSDIIRRNTGIDEIQTHVFLVPERHGRRAPLGPRR